MIKPMQQAHVINPTVIRAYDIRGIWNKTLTAQDFEVLARAFAADLIERGGRTVCMSHDVRHSCTEIQAAITKGLVESGIDVTHIGMGPSPMLYFAQKYLNTDAGLMITGSHNPPEYNGLKICLRDSPYFGDDLINLRDRANAGHFVQGQGQVKHTQVLDAYVDYLLKDFHLHYSTGRKMKIAWDPANGAACQVVEKLTQRLPGVHIVINGTADGAFPSHHPDPCVEENMQQLKAVVLQEGCDLGIGLDGDADRIGVVDGQGRHIMGDQLLMCLAEEIVHTHPGAIVLADVKSSQVLFDRLEKLGLTPRMTKTGHSHIKALLKNLKSPLAGEMSGHVFFADRYYGYDDGIYAALRLIGALSLRDESLSQWYDQVPKTFITPETWHLCDDEHKFTRIEEITFNLKEQGADFCDADGVRVKTEDGWWLLRASNTQAVLVSRAESHTQEGLDRLKNEIKNHLSSVNIG